MLKNLVSEARVVEYAVGVLLACRGAVVSPRDASGPVLAGAAGVRFKSTKAKRSEKIQAHNL